MFKNILLKRKSYHFINFTKRGYCCNFSENINNVLVNHKVGDKINLKGWLRSTRKQKQSVFADLHDGLSEKHIQIVIPKEIVAEGISSGASISVIGRINKSPKGQIELLAEHIKVYGRCVFSDGFPLSPKKEYSPEHIRQFLHLRPRHSLFASLLRIRSKALLSIHEYFNTQGYTHIHTPILTSNDCEGAGEVFSVKPNNQELLKQMVKKGVPFDEAFFDRMVFLSVSGQLHLEAAVSALSKVYSLGPTFRAENSKTRFHLSEFYMLEAEIAFMETLDHLMNEIEHMVKSVSKKILDCFADHELIRKDLHWLDRKFPIITYEEAINIIKNNSQELGSFDKMDGLTKEHEIFLTKHLGNIPVFVIKWPRDVKPFYMKTCVEDESKVAALDLLAPHVGEFVGGSLREDDYDKLKNSIPKGISNLDWYLDLRKYGGVPTGGYGLGFDRYMLLLLNINNVKDVIPFPRWPHNCNL